jgi:hypothetical protein
VLLGFGGAFLEDRDEEVNQQFWVSEYCGPRRV